MRKVLEKITKLRSEISSIDSDLVRNIERQAKSQISSGFTKAFLEDSNYVRIRISIETIICTHEEHDKLERLIPKYIKELCKFKDYFGRNLLE